MFFFDMCNESEHSANKFRYPGVLEDAELLQSPAHPESTMKEFTTFSEAHIKQTVGPLAQSTERAADNAPMSGGLDPHMDHCNLHLLFNFAIVVVFLM